MKVWAKCTNRAWDSTAAMMYIPGCGPGPDGTYQIEHDGILSQMKYLDHFVFLFDRTGTRTNDGEFVVKDYSCKQCGMKCKSLNDLGTHTNKAHREFEKTDSIDPEEAKSSDRTCGTCGHVCASARGLTLHMKLKHEPATEVEDEA